MKRTAPSLFFLPEIASEGNLGQKKDKTLVLGVALAIIALLTLSAQVDAKIVTFSDGRVLKAEDAYLDGEIIVIELRGGGTMRVPATRVDRVIADEVDEIPIPIPELGDCSWTWENENPPDGMPFGEEIWAAAKRAGIHPWLLVQVVRAESNFDLMAVSRAGATGLTQLMPSTAAAHGVTNVFDADQNLNAGATYLRAMLDRFDSLTLALAAYNAGPATVARYDGVPPYRETRNYVRKITKWFCGGDED